MTRPDFKTITFKRGTIAALLACNNENTSEANYLLSLAADGLRSRMKKWGYRPPLAMIEQRLILPEEIFAFYAQWVDAIDSSCGIVSGCLNSQYRFAVVPKESQWYEPGIETAIPVHKKKWIDDWRVFDTQLGHPFILSKDDEKFLRGDADEKS